jgi:hypothetical protein
MPLLPLQIKELNQALIDLGQEMLKTPSRVTGTGAFKTVTCY